MKAIKEFFAKNKGAIATHIVLFALMFLLERGNILSVMSPFGYSFAFALVLAGKNGIAIAISYFLSCILNNLSLSGLVIGLCAASTLLLLYLIYFLAKKKIHLVSALLFSCFSQAGFLYYNLGSGEQIIISLVSLVLGMCFVYIFYAAASAVFYRGLQSRYTTDEGICFAVFLIALFSGLAGLYIKNINISIYLATFIILFFSRILEKKATLYLAALAGIGFAMRSGSLTSEAILVCYAIIATALKSNRRILLALMIIICDALFGMFFNSYVVYDIYSLITLFALLIIFIGFPEKYLKKLRGLSYAYDGSLVNDYLILGEREFLKERLGELGKLFSQMQAEYRNLSIGEVERSEAAAMLSGELVSRHCKACPRYKTCMDTNEMKSAFIKLFEFGMEKGKVTIIDASSLLTSHCSSISSVIAEVNSALKIYFEYEKTIKSSDQSKIISSEQMGATSEVFYELSKTCFSKLRPSAKKGKELLGEFSANHIIVNECAVFEGEEGEIKVVLVIRNSDVLSPKVLESAKAVFGMDFSVTSRKMAKFSGWSILVLEPSDKYKISIGFASSAKSDSGISGDTKAIEKISAHKYLFAISDGMGHGEKANKIASSALSLIESFYKAGLSSESIISNVNRIFLQEDEDNFVTLDAAVVDLMTATADFVKIGASVSVIKGENESRVVSADSLPLGITTALAPKVENRILREKDIIIIASDGIVDSFDRVEDYVAFVNNERVINVQMLADNILEEAESRTRHRDDMTVIAVKVSPLY